MQMLWPHKDYLDKAFAFTYLTSFLLQLGAVRGCPVQKMAGLRAQTEYAQW